MIDLDAIRRRNETEPPSADLDALIGEVERLRATVGLLLGWLVFPEGHAWRVPVLDGALFHAPIDAANAIFRADGLPPIPADFEGPCPFGLHEWTGQKRGGPPDAAESHEWVEYCKVCGAERTED